MYLSFRQKRRIFNSFPELTEIVMRNGKINYNYENSSITRKQIARELSYTGNGYIYGAYLENCEYPMDQKGWISIRELSEPELQNLIERVIRSFTSDSVSKSTKAP